jgi:hypothetical protein
MRRKLLIGAAVVLAVGVVAFLVAHALIPESKPVSDHNQVDPAVPWSRGDPVVGEPTGVFDGTGVLSDPCVVRDGKGYRMWFTLATGVGTPEQTLGIAEAESDDGRTWRSAGRHVLAPDPAGWDAGGVETACVVRRKSGGWLMYYTGDRPPVGGHHMSIGLATSDDGRTWTRWPGGPILEGVNEWERAFEDAPGGPKIGGVLEPSVLVDEATGRYRMWYAGLGKVAGQVQYCIGYAESDDGVTWRRDPEPVFRPSESGWDDALVSHCHVAAGPDGKLHLFYFGSSKLQYQECEALGGCAMTPGAIGHAVSDDGRAWQRVSRLPAVSPRPGEWDSWAVGGPCGLFEEGRWRLWYFGNGGHNTYKARIGTVSRGP